MTEYVKRPVFLRDVQVGDRFQLMSRKERDPWVVTGRHYESEKDQVQLIGLTDDGEPVSQDGLGWLPAVIEVPMPIEEQQQ